MACKLISTFINHMLRQEIMQKKVTNDPSLVKEFKKP